MTNTPKENIERKLDHLLDMMEMVGMQYRHITCTERVGLLLALAADAKQVTRNVGIMRETLVKRIVDEFGVDYADYRRRIQAALDKLVELTAGAPMVHNIDNSIYPITGGANIVEAENNCYLMNDIKGVVRIDYMRQYLMENSGRIYESIVDDVRLIIADLAGIDRDMQLMVEGKLQLSKHYADLMEQYKQAMWEKDRQEFEQRLDRCISLWGNTLSSFERMKNDMTDDLDELTLSWLDGYPPERWAARNRKQLTIGDMALHFKNRLCMDLLDEIASKVKDAIASGSYPISRQGDIVNIVLGNYIEKQYITQKENA